MGSPHHQARITYIVQNCFLVSLSDRVFLFDYPTDRFLEPGMKQRVLSGIAGRPCYLVLSHGHPDHCTTAPEELVHVAGELHPFLSWDVMEMHGQRFPSSATVLEPDETITFRDMSIHSFESNDSGIAAVISLPGLTLYFGGDLADWAWDAASDAARRETRRYFLETLRNISSHSIDIAFSNADPRLSDWSGARDVIDILHPSYFVPMHLFNRPAAISRFHQALPLPRGTIFHYEQSGDYRDLVFEGQKWTETSAPLNGDQSR